MRRLSSTVIALALVLGGTALFVDPAPAEVYTIELNNGTTFQSRYEPVEADWDSTKIVFLNELGTRISLSKDDVAEVASETETSGFGTILDSTTIDLGYLPNDMPTPEDLEAGDERTPAERIREQMRVYRENQPSYDMQQFVEPSATGGGIPVGAIRSQPSASGPTGPGGGGGG